MKRLLAIDPGKSGGICYVDCNYTAVAVNMPETDGDVLDLLRTLRASGIEDAVIEKVGGFVGGKGSPGSSMFRFGDGCGFLRGCLMALGFRVEMVTPQRWQKSLGLGTASSCSSKKEWKNKLKAEAQRRFPHTSVTLSTADALLIMDWKLNGDKT